jgi:hypothetical protein
MTQQALLLTLATIKSKKTGGVFDICHVYQEGQINVAIIPNKDTSQVGQRLDYVKQGGRPCELNIKVQGTRVLYLDIKVLADK